MLSRSYFNLLNLDDYSSDFTSISSVISVPGIVSDFEDSMNKDTVDCPRSPVNQGRRIIVTKQLPLKSSHQATQGTDSNKWCFEWDKDSLYFQLKDGFSSEVEVVYVGCLGVEIDPSEQDEMAQFLFEKFKCVPTFLPLDLTNKFYHGFCKHYLWPLFHYMLPLTPSHGVRFDKATWQSYVSANKIFADKVMEVINPDEDYVWVHDYHLMILPTFLRLRFHRAKIGFFLHIPFPSSEIFRTLPVREEILRALLNCDLVGLHNFDYARHFLSCCSRMLGLDYQSKRGYIGLDYYGRTVCIKILPVGIHMNQILSVMSLSDTAHKIKKLKDEYDGKIVLLGVDDMDVFKGISLKFMALGLLLEENPYYRGKVVLVQIMNAPRSRGKDVQEVQNEIDKVASEINQKYGESGYKPIVCLNGPISFQDKVAYYAVAECVIVNCVRDGMNLVPYKYTVSRQGMPELDKAFGLESSAKKSVIIVSEFIGCSPSLSGAIRVNPWNVSSVSEAMRSGLTMPDSEKELRHEKHFKYVASHDVAYWARSFGQDLERACSDHYRKRCWGIGFGLNWRVVALGPNFRKLSLDHIVSAYNSTVSRLILLDYDGTMMPQDRVDISPSPEVLSVLNGLCNDPKNLVFIISGRGKDSLGQWFSQCERLGLSAEHGYFIRWIENSEWAESCGPNIDLDWKRIVLPIMEQYTEATDGSSIEEKESAVVWHYREADADFGSWQAKELLDHLESVLANDPVLVKSGQQIVEVKPQGVSKGVVVKNLIETVKNEGKSLDFVLCIGDDRSDEDMFEAIASSMADLTLPETSQVFACTVGQKPSKAKYYLDDTVEVINMLRGLSTASVQQISKASHDQSLKGQFEILKK